MERRGYTIRMLMPHIEGMHTDATPTTVNKASNPMVSVYFPDPVASKPPSCGSIPAKTLFICHLS